MFLNQNSLNLSNKLSSQPFLIASSNSLVNATYNKEWRYSNEDLLIEIIKKKSTKQNKSKLKREKSKSTKSKVK